MNGGNISIPGLPDKTEIPSGEDDGVYRKAAKVTKGREEWIFGLDGSWSGLKLFPISFALLCVLCAFAVKL
jgi:hypothetical protein